MPISTINRIKTIAKKLNTNDNSILTIYENNGLTVGNELIADHTIISFNCFIKNLRAFALINSLSEAALPNFELEDSETDKLYKTLDIEWKSARKQLTMYISNGGDWIKVGSISLLNPSGYPYRIYSLMDSYTDGLAVELGDNGKIGVQVENVGYGLLDATDEVTIHGCYLEEIFVQLPEPNPITIVNSGGSNSGSTGGGSTTPTPTPYTFAPLFRISADDLELLDNDLVETWQQTGSSQSTVAQYSFENQPTYKSNIINGKSAVYFETDKFLTVEPSRNFSSSVLLIPSIGDWVIFLVGSLGNTGYAMVNYSYTDPSHKGFVRLSYYATEVGVWSEYVGRQRYSFEYSAQDWNIYVVRRKNDLITTLINGVPFGDRNVSMPLTYESYYLASAVIGRNYVDDNYLTGYIADIAILNSHSDIDINEIGNYYKNLYNLSWTNI